MIRFEDENKDLFVQRLNDALIECGGGRYDHLRNDPAIYVDNGGGDEAVYVDSHLVDVGGSSLAAMLIDIGVALTS